MTDQERKTAVHAVDILNDFIGDLIGATMLFRYWNDQFRQGHIPTDVMVNVQKICISHLVLTLCKFEEFYRRFNRIIPSKHAETCKALWREIEKKDVVEFRNKCVGHIWDKQQRRPLLHSEIMKRLARLTGGDMPGFLNWITPTANAIPPSVVGIVETVRDALMSDYSISPDEFIER